MENSIKKISRAKLAVEAPAGSSKTVGALTNGIAILRFLARVDEPVGMTRVARELDLNPSTSFNLLKTMVQERLVTFDPGNKTYSLGLGFVELARNSLEKANYPRLVRPHLEELAASYALTATLWQRSGEDRIVLVERVDSDHALRVYMTIGQRLPLYIAALGRVMAAYTGLSRSELRQKFAELRWQNSPSFEDYLRDIESVHTKGYAVDKDNFVRGVTTISAPIFTDGDIPTLAISAVGFTAQLSDAVVHEIGQYLQEASLRISGAFAGGAAKREPRRS
jgi:DNA-binding IclR family transcriptional regulator